MSRYVNILVQSLAAVAVILPLAVQAADSEKERAVVVPQTANEELSKKFVNSMGGTFALVFTKDGIVAIDAEGYKLSSCQLGVETATDRRPTCGSTTRTAIKGVKTLSVIEHLGSTCYLIALPPNGGMTLYYDTCTKRIQ